MAPLSEVIKEAETIAGDVLQSLPDIAGIVKKIDPHLTAVDQVIELAPRLEAVVTRLEQIAGIALPEPPAPKGAAPAPTGKAPIEVSAPAKPEPETQAETTTDTAGEDKVTIEVTPEQAAALGKTPIQITAPAKQ